LASNSGVSAGFGKLTVSQLTRKKQFERLVWVKYSGKLADH
jgi:hypothetical protein